MQEFSFLDADRCNNTTQEERLPWVEAYFARNDPDYVDGRDAESFNQMLSRVDDMLARLRKLRKRNVIVFSHGNFMRAVMLRLRNLPPELPVFRAAAGMGKYGSLRFDLLFVKKAYGR